MVMPAPTWEAESALPTVGEPAPAVELITLDGMKVALASLWQERPVALVLFRPVNSELCVDQAVTLRDAHEYMQQAGGDFVAVCGSSPIAAINLRDRWNLPFTLLCDPAAAAYGAYGVSVELPGSFVVGTDGLLHFVHRSKDMLDNPSTWSLIGVVCTLTGRIVDQPEPTQTNGQADEIDVPATPELGAPLPNYVCSKCGYGDAEVQDLSATSGMMSRMVNLQNRRFTAVSCRQCKYTDLYKTESGKLRNIFDLFIGK
jgi:predicted nucleic-acid-binding Zn-ribbon protein/peroxiredoxin